MLSVLPDDILSAGGPYRLRLHEAHMEGRLSRASGDRPAGGGVGVGMGAGAVPGAPRAEVPA